MAVAGGSTTGTRRIPGSRSLLTLAALGVALAAADTYVVVLAMTVMGGFIVTLSFGDRIFARTTRNTRK